MEDSSLEAVGGHENLHIGYSAHANIDISAKLRGIGTRMEGIALNTLGTNCEGIAGEVFAESLNCRSAGFVSTDIHPDVACLNVRHSDSKVANGAVSESICGVVSSDEGDLAANSLLFKGMMVRDGFVVNGKDI